MSARPVFKKPRQIIFAFREEVVKELEMMKGEGVIEKVAQFGCGNYKIIHLKDCNYPLPRIADIFAALQDEREYIKLDFRKAYNQLCLDEQTYELLSTEPTHKKEKHPNEVLHKAYGITNTEYNRQEQG